MASSFVTGCKFRERVNYFIKKDSSFPLDLKEELENILRNDEPSILSFTTARKIQKYLQHRGYPVYLHQLLADSTIYLPPVEKPPRNPQLVARLERIKAKLANEEYMRITRNVNAQEMNRHGTMADFGRQESDFCSDRSLRCGTCGAVCSGQNHGGGVRGAVATITCNHHLCQVYHTGNQHQFRSSRRKPTPIQTRHTGNQPQFRHITQETNPNPDTSHRKPTPIQTRHKGNQPQFRHVTQEPNPNSDSLQGKFTAK